MENYIGMNWYNRQLKIAGRPGRVWSNKELNKIKSLLEEGKPIRQISRILGTYPRMIRFLNKKKSKKNEITEIFRP